MASQEISIREKMVTGFQVKDDPIRLTHDAPGELWFSDSPTIGVDSQGWVHVVWSDERAAEAHNEYAGFRDLYYKYYNGSEWSTDQQITFHNGTSYAPVLVVDAYDRLHLVWQDSRYGHSEIYYMVNDGKIWNTESRVTTSPIDSLNPAIAIDSEKNTYILWQEGSEEAGFAIFYKYHNETDWSDVFQLTTASQSARNPTIAIDSQNSLHLVWVDERHNTRELYSRVYQANKWGDEQRLTKTENHSESPILLVDSQDTLHLVWLEKTTKSPYESHIYYKGNDGIEWTVEQQVTGNPLDPPLEYPVLAYAKRADSLSATCDSFDHIHLCWQDIRERRREIFYMERVGSAWSLDIPLTVDDRSDSVSPAIGVDHNSEIHVVWSDHRHAELSTGNTEIYYKRGKIPIVTVSKPEVTYHIDTKTIDIVRVVAISNIPIRDIMDPSETQVNYYRIYDAFDVYTGLSGNITWTGEEWEVKNINVSNLDLGEYYVRCFFADNQAFGVSNPSEHFYIRLTTSTSTMSSTSSTQPPVTPELPYWLPITFLIGLLIVYINIRRYQAG